MATRSVLFPGGAVDTPADTTPECFRDLNLGQIVSHVAEPWKAYGLQRFYASAPADAATVAYRQAVMRDIDGQPPAAGLAAFSARMRGMRHALAMRGQSPYALERARRFLGAVRAYVDAVAKLDATLTAGPLRSDGLRSLHDYVAQYVARAEFANLTRDVAAAEEALGAVTYAIHIDGLNVTVLPYEHDPDYALEVERVFERFRRDAGPARQTAPVDAGALNHVEAGILERVARLHPEPFHVLERFCSRHAEYLDAQIAAFDAELPYYLAYLDAIAPLRNAGLAFAYPALSDSDKTTEIRAGFDLALAWRLAERSERPVGNDVSLGGGERLIVVSGPNHGGKTTFARMIGQVHYLARLGFPVPAAAARLFICDRILTHFERAETVEQGRGKLQDDLVRLHALLGRATPASLVILNEIFSSTTVHDALYLGREVLSELSRRDVLGVCVTFLDELSALDEKTVSMVGGVDPRDPAIRTYHIERRPADGLAYAHAIAEKYRVTGDWLRRRLGP